VITATVPGATITSTGIDIVNANTSTTICQTVTVIDYGVVECLTKMITIDAGTNLTITQAGVSYPCVNSDLT
jgi:voltage-gated potassium channel Kch